MDLLTHMFRSVARMWRDLTTSHRIALGCLSALLVFSLVWGLASAASPAYSRLVSSEDQHVAREVKKALDQTDYRSYEVRWDGIHVPARDRDRLLLDVLHVRVQPLQEERARGGSRIPRPEAADLRLLVDVISTEAFIGSLTCNDYFEAAISNQF